MDSFFSGEAADGVGVDSKLVYRTVEGLYETLNGLGMRAIRRSRPLNATFEGWVDPVSGFRCGEGMVTWNNGDTFSGTFVDDRPNCGSFESTVHGLKYVGTLSRSGRFETNEEPATLIYTDMSTYNGHFKDGMYRGKGMLVMSHCAVDCEWESGLKEGVGVIKDSLGRKIYSGEFHRDEYHGMGSQWEYLGEDQEPCRWYSGLFKLSQYYGEGTLSDGNVIYEGQFLAGTKHGEGKETVTKDGKETVKEGRWEMGNDENGEWLIKYTDGTQYIGECVGGQPEGRGTLKLNTGDNYVGEFRAGLREGQGIVVFAGGDSFEGHWRNDCPIGLNIFIGEAGSPNKPTRKFVSDVTDFTLSEISLNEEEKEEDKEEEEGKREKEGEIHAQSKEDQTSVFIYENGDEYHGTIDEQGRRQGRGVYTVKRTGARCEAFFVNDSREGSGTLVDKYMSFEGFFTEDRFLEGTLCMRGLYTYKGKFNGDGEFEDDAGQMIDQYGNAYYGGFVRGVKEGAARCTSSDGTIFVGEVRRNRREGEGTVKKGDDFIYCGGFHNDRYHGHGILNTKDGGVYDGNFHNGWFSGFGRLETNKKSMETQFSHGKTVAGADAVIKWKDGSLYTGSIDENGLPQGNGTVKFKNGDVYIGEMREGERHGRGETIFANGESFKGLWTRDTMGKGKLTLASGVVHEYDE